MGGLPVRGGTIATAAASRSTRPATATPAPMGEPSVWGLADAVGTVIRELDLRDIHLEKHWK